MYITAGLWFDFSVKRYQRAVEEHPQLAGFPRPLNQYLEALDYSAEKVRLAMTPATQPNSPPVHERLIGKYKVTP